MISQMLDAGTMVLNLVEDAKGIGGIGEKVARIIPVHLTHGGCGSIMFSILDLLGIIDNDIFTAKGDEGEE